MQRTLSEDSTVKLISQHHLVMCEQDTENNPRCLENFQKDLHPCIAIVICLDILPMGLCIVSVDVNAGLLV